MEVHFACLSADTAVPLIDIWTTPADRAQFDQRPPAAARDALAARAALRAMLAKETGYGPWELRADGAGKPFAWTQAGEVGPAITLSHSAGMVAVAVGAPGTALGIDIEVHKPREYDKIAAQFFGPEERVAVECGGADAFYRIWTAREARAKATGIGFADVLFGGDRVGAGADLGRWQQACFFFRHQRPLRHFSLTLAANAPLPLRPAATLL
jgi:4'-phosphopantetheinyl transferase EntD